MANKIITTTNLLTRKGKLDYNKKFTIFNAPTKFIYMTKLKSFSYLKTKRHVKNNQQDQVF